MDKYVKHKDYGLDGSYYLEFITLDIPAWISYFYTAYDYDFNGIKHITNCDMLGEYLDAYFHHHMLYGEDNVTQKVEEVIDEYLVKYLEDAPSTVFKLRDKSVYLYLEDVTFHPQDYPRSVLAHPSISYFYHANQQKIFEELKQQFIAEEYLKYVDQVAVTFIDEIKALIDQRVKVIWEVPHTIYKHIEPFTDDDIRDGTVKPLAYLNKYEHKFYDYEVGFNERMYYKVVEHLPSGDFVLTPKWYREGMHDDWHHPTLEERRDENYSESEWRPPIGDMIPSYEDILYEFFVPYPYIVRSPSCRQLQSPEATNREGRFSKTMPWGGDIYPCDPPPPGPPPENIVHVITHKFSKIGGRLYLSSVTADTTVRILEYKIESSSDMRDYSPPKILSSDEWYLVENFGEYPSLVSRQQEEWWDDYRDANITNHQQWHSFWQEHMLVDKDHLTWYINSHIDRENKL